MICVIYIEQIHYRLNIPRGFDCRPLDLINKVFRTKNEGLKKKAKTLCGFICLLSKANVMREEMFHE